MISLVRKISAMALVALVLFFTIISILAIWDIIKIEQILQKSLTTLLVIFVASAIVLFIFSVLYKAEEKQ
ncbi:MAG: hypothetical protein HY063_11750 [Bacteroidetes bacterium]|nr:hypothetical protein [Bacteroidota bacterium]